jgi:hypothetical protein
MDEAGISFDAQSFHRTTRASAEHAPPVFTAVAVAVAFGFGVNNVTTLTAVETSVVDAAP